MTEKSNTNGVHAGVAETKKDITTKEQSEALGEKHGKVATGKRIPKKVDVELPGPSPTDQPIPKKPVSKAKKNQHTRAPSVVSATSADSTEAANTSAKPPSIRGADKPSSSRSGSQDEHSDDDDAVSVAESTTRIPRKRKREPDRVQFFKDDPQCADVEPHRAHCAKCGAWVPLHEKRRYVMRFWLEHRKACAGSSGCAPPEAGPGAPGQAEADGRAALERDARTGEIRPHEVFCTACDAWVPLDPAARYVTANWEAHARACPGTVAMPPPDAASGSDAPAPSADAPAHPVPPDSPEKGRDAPAGLVPTTPAAPSRKRGRSEDSEDVDERTRSVRPRPASYTPSRKQVLWHTLTAPIRSFVQGFKEGMNPSASSSSPSSS